MKTKLSAFAAAGKDDYRTEVDALQKAVDDLETALGNRHGRRGRRERRCNRRPCTRRPAGSDRAVHQAHRRLRFVTWSDPPDPTGGYRVEGTATAGEYLCSQRLGCGEPESPARYAFPRTPGHTGLECRR